MPHPTQADIAKALNVTRITVSKALRDHPDISPDMKIRVRQVADELGYVPNFMARNLASKKSSTIGVIVPEIANPFFSHAIDKMIDTVSDRGYHIILTVSRETETIEIQNIETLLSMRVDGFLVSVSQHSIHPKNFNPILKRNVPLVFFGREIEELDCCSVVFDDRKAAIEGMDFVIQQGYRRIAHIA